MRLPSTADVIPLTGGLRLGIGGVMLARPGLLGAVLGMDRATARRSGWLAQMIAGRELALGMGTLVSGRQGGARPWLAGQMIADSVDAVALALAIRAKAVHPLLAGAVVGVAGLAIAAEAAAWRAAARP